jgi:hypothetical protein
MFEKTPERAGGPDRVLHFADPLYHFRCWLWGFIPGTMMPKWDSGPLPCPQEASCTEAGGRRGGLATFSGLSPGPYPEDQPKMNRRAASAVPRKRQLRIPSTNSAVPTTISTSHMTSFTFHLQPTCCILSRWGGITKTMGFVSIVSMHRSQSSSPPLHLPFHHRGE